MPDGAGTVHYSFWAGAFRWPGYVEANLWVGAMVVNALTSECFVVTAPGAGGFSPISPIRLELGSTVEGEANG